MFSRQRARVRVRAQIWVILSCHSFMWDGVNVAQQLLVPTQCCITSNSYILMDRKLMASLPNIVHSLWFD